MNINPESWKQDLPAFKEKTDAFYRGVELLTLMV